MGDVKILRIELRLRDSESRVLTTILYLHAGLVGVVGVGVNFVAIYT